MGSDRARLDEAEDHGRSPSARQDTARPEGRAGDGFLPPHYPAFTPEEDKTDLRSTIPCLRADLPFGVVQELGTKRVGDRGRWVSCRVGAKA
jgi:hypothetical protein